MYDFLLTKRFHFTPINGYNANPASIFERELLIFKQVVLVIYYCLTQKQRVEG